MGDLSKIKIAIGQIELVEGSPSKNEAACDAMIDRALDEGADVLVLPNSLTDESDVKVIGLNDSRIDVAGNVVVVDVRGDSFRIGLGDHQEGCDLSIRADLRPFNLEEGVREKGGSGIVLRPVGIRERGQKVLALAGGSRAFAQDGTCVLALGSDFQEDFGVVDFSQRVKLAADSDVSLLDAVVMSLKRFDEQVFSYAPKWVVGLSGGLDSSITTALLAMALGSERVLAYNMATRYNSTATKTNAAKLAEALGISLKNGSIEGLVVSMGNTLVRYGYPQDALKGLVLENVQARTRANLLSTFAAVEGGVIVNNGNRVECALGYATLYGDSIGAFAPIADLTKVQLFDLAHQINGRFGFEVIPENLMPTITDDELVWQTMPSAELANGQLDPMKWFYHDWLVGKLLGDGKEQALPLYDEACEIMQEYLEDRLASTPAARWVAAYGLDEPAAFAEDLEWVVGSMKRSAFKRIQAPPALRIASRASVGASAESQSYQEPPVLYNALMRKIRLL